MGGACKGNKIGEHVKGYKCEKFQEIEYVTDAKCKEETNKLVKNIYDIYEVISEKHCEREITEKSNKEDYENEAKKNSQKKTYYEHENECNAYYEIEYEII